MRTAVLLCALALLLAVGQVHATSGKCRALAISGGGDKAAYEAGVIRGLMSALPSEETSYNVVTGISSGSTLTAMFSMFHLGEEKAAVDRIYQVLKELNQSTIFQDWPGGVMEGFFQHSSLFDSTPLRRLLERNVAGGTVAKDRRSCIGVSNLRTGLFERLCKFNSVQDVVDASLASAAIAGVFIAQTIRGETYVDGGCTVNVDVVGAVEECMALGYPQQDVIVDVIQCGSANITELPGDMSELTVLPILLRSMSMQTFSGSHRDFLDAQRQYPQAHYRYLVEPSEPIGGSGIDFNQTRMRWMEELGEHDGRAAVKAGQFQTRLALE